MKNIYKTASLIKLGKETPKVKNFIVDLSIKAKPGQYLMVWLPGVNEKPFSIVSCSPLTLAIAAVGPFTSKIHQLKVGDKLTFRGPYGKSFKIKGNRILLVGGGYGTAPLYFLAQTISKSKRKKVTVIIGAKTKSELPFVSKFKKLGCRVMATTDDGSSGFKGFTPQLAEKLIEKEKFNSVYVCGPEIMMKKIAGICQRKKIFCQVSMERIFKCGLGLCGECSCSGKLVCRDGPVFNGKILGD